MDNSFAKKFDECGRTDKVLNYAIAIDNVSVVFPLKFLMSTTSFQFF